MSDESIINEYTPEYVQYLAKLAEENLLRGIIEEPRVYFDEIQVPQAPIQQQGGSNIFANGEKFPVRLTHMTLIPRYTALNGSDVIPEQMIQRMGLQLGFHDSYYMNPNFVAAPNWCTRPSATPPGVSESTATWHFTRPVVFSARDTLVVQVQLLTLPAGEFVRVPVNVTFIGVGIMSKRPYFFNGQIALFDTALRAIPSAFYRNDGAEPVLITDMVVNTGGIIGDADASVGNIRNVRVQVKQNGNGTNSEWFIGPVAPGPQAVCAANLGVYAGRCIVHEFPGQGLLWEPGEGVSVFVQGLDEFSEPAFLSIALSGYISVQ